MGSGKPRYRAQRAILARSVHHHGLPIPAWPDLSDTTPSGIGSWCTWIRETWRIPELAEAVRHASADLARELDALAEVTSVDTATARRLAVSLIGYTLRMQQRPMPFGLFAGVTEGQFGDRTRAHWGHGHKAVARADASWLADLVQQLEETPEVRQRLRLIANNALRLRGDRLVLPWQPRRRGAVGTAVQEVSLRHTAAVRAVVQMTCTPVLYRDVMGKLTADDPGLDARAAQELLDLLISRRVLLTSLQPPTTEPDALGHVLAQLRRSGAGQSEQCAAMVSALRDIHAQMETHNQQPAPEGSRQRTELRTRMRQHGDQGNPLAFDLRLDADLLLPRAVAWEAEAATGLLTRLTANPHGTQAWIRYRQRFQERYGDNALVPLQDLLNPHTGLGLPEDYHGTPQTPHPSVSRRDTALLACAQQAIADGGEINLDEALVEELTAGTPAASDAPPHVELMAEVHAPSARDLDEGRFELAVRRTSRGWAHFTGGRFAALLASDDRPSELLGTLARRPTTVKGALPVQLSFPALSRGAAHITRTPRLVAPLISLSEYRDADPDVIALSDLAVICHGDRLHLVSRSREKVLEAATPYPLQIECHTPTVARFLDELQRGQSSQLINPRGDLAAWDWGAVRHLPLWPRVRYGRSILSPATWDLAHAALPGRDASTAQWEDALVALRKRWGLPGRVYVEHFDLRLRLNLDEPAHLALLRAQFERPRPLGQLSLVEAEPEDAFGWCGGRPNEIVTLLASTATRRPAPPVRTAPTIRHSDAHLPGASPYLAARLYGEPQARPGLLADHLPALLNDLGHPQWWVTPHDDEDRPHTVLTIRLPHTTGAAEAVQGLGCWADRLAETGALGDFAIVPHRSHPGLWGRGDLLTAAENALAADSRALAHQAAHIRGLDPQVLTAANLIAITAGFQQDTTAGLKWLATQPKPPAAQPLSRDLVRQARLLADPVRDWPGLRGIPGGRELIDIHWSRRHVNLADYRTALPHAQHSNTVLHALLDAHLRLATGTPSAQATSWRLARSVALANLHNAERQPVRPDLPHTRAVPRADHTNAEWMHQS
ncbi:lantibiotic dehydratase [Streptomyces sp. NPDC056304]|uniref:lantibiotic dehydratase n=1 Tax=Streptomyces sp. NPDC056304 TaxID=3345778 RepID=UPI0035DC78EF